jgi:Plavaka transposase
VVPVIIGSDKTHLTDFSGDKKAWPVYLSIGNLSMKARRTPSLKAWIIIGYMPVVAWNNPDDIAGTLSMRLFHQCAKIIFKPLIEPGTSGKLLKDSLGQERLCFPRLAAWLADYQEQVLLNCVAYGTCPVTLAGGGSLGSVDPSPPRTTRWILDQIRHVLNNVDPGDIKNYQAAARERMLNGVHAPFWEDLPGYQAHLCVAPDLFHGVIRFARDHMLKWTRRLVGISEFDERLKDLQTNRGFRNFKKGIDHLAQMTGREDRELQRVTVALIAGAPKVSPKAMRCIRAFHDFLYLTQYRSHDQETIGYLSDALEIFHRTKNVFIETGVRKGKGRVVLNHFEIPKIAAFHSYAWHIPQLGSSTQFSTEIIETLHKPMAKQPYKGSNRYDYAVQMCRYLDRRERVAHARGIHAWRTLQEQEENITMALSGLSPRHRLLVKDQFFKPKEQPISRLEKHRKNTSLWLNLQPTYRQTTLTHLATTYQLPTLIADVDRYLTAADDGSEGIARQGAVEVLYVDAWEKLRIRVSDVQDDNEFSHIHTVEALPPGAQEGRYPYGHGHCVLVHHTAEAQAVGIEGKPPMYSVSIHS